MGTDRNSREIRPNMAENLGESGYIQLTANIVSAYVSNNTVASAEIPNLIAQVLLRINADFERPNGAAGRTAQAGRGGQAIRHARIYCVPRRRQEVQIAQAPPANPVRHNAGTISREMGIAAHYPMVAPNYAAARSQLAKQMGLGQQRRRRRSAADRSHRLF